MTASKSSIELHVEPVNARRWSDFEKLFEAKGSPKYCWCMAWRASSKDPLSKNGAGRKILMEKLVADEVPVGLIGYLGTEPVAWCSIGPFDTFRGLRKVDEPTEKIWSVTCFFVRREHRGKGFTGQMLSAAVSHASEHGAKLVEGYPVDPSSPSYRHMGFVRLFQAAGFSEVGREGTRRHIMQIPTQGA